MQKVNIFSARKCGLLIPPSLRQVLCVRRYKQNVGGLLAPPCSAEHSMGPLTPRRVPIEGNSWRESSADIAIAGLGWLGIGVKGRAAFYVWTPEGASTPALHFFRNNILPEAVV